MESLVTGPWWASGGLSPEVLSTSVDVNIIVIIEVLNL